MNVTCDWCDGTGRFKGAPSDDCAHCYGTGRLPAVTDILKAADALVRRAEQLAVNDLPTREMCRMAREAIRAASLVRGFEGAIQ